LARARKLKYLISVGCGTSLIRGAVGNVVKIFLLEKSTILLLWFFHPGITPSTPGKICVPLYPMQNVIILGQPLLGERFVWVGGGWVVGGWVGVGIG
jgi:hypothetical protein